VEKGKLADLVLWSPAFFGVKPECIIKGGSIVAAPMGDPNASIPTPQPVHYQPMFAAFGKALTASSWCSSSKAAVASGLARSSASARSSTPSRYPWRPLQEEHDPQRRHAENRGRSRTYEVRADGELLTCAPAEVLPMAQRYFMY